MQPPKRIIRRLVPKEPRNRSLRAPKRSTVGLLHKLPDWKPSISEQVIVPDPSRPPEEQQQWYDPPGQKATIEYVKEVTKYQSGWWLVTPDQVQPLPSGWALAPSCKELLTSDAAGRPSLRSVTYRASRLWAGHCVKCNKRTLATSTQFLRGQKCLHCHPHHTGAPDNPGNNLFIAGNNPIGSALYLLTSGTKEQAAQKAKENGFAWVTPIHTSRRGKTINLPTTPDPEDRQPNAWAFALGDSPDNFKKVSATWQGADNREWAWFEQPKDEEDDEMPAPPLPASDLIPFDDFM